MCAEQNRFQVTANVYVRAHSLQADPLTKAPVIDGTKFQLQCLSAQLLFSFLDLKIELAIAQALPGQKQRPSNLLSFKCLLPECLYPPVSQTFSRNIVRHKNRNSYGGILGNLKPNNNNNFGLILIYLIFITIAVGLAEFS